MLRRNTTLALLFIILFSCKEQNAIPYEHNNGEPEHIRMIVFAGESNSGGQALNRDASTDELSARQGTHILHNYTLSFEQLHIGMNNLLGHYGMKSDTTMHSWELELANKEAAGEFFDDLYIVKTGQGGSKISQWEKSKPFADTFDKRLTAAIGNLSNETDKVHFAMFYSQGINDLIADDWDADNWERKTIERFNYLRQKYGHFPIIMTKFFNIPGKKVDELNEAIENVCDKITDCHFVETGDLPRDDKYHFSYLGQKILADLLVNKLKSAGYFL
jgi:hypothetical protein